MLNLFKSKDTQHKEGYKARNQRLNLNEDQVWECTDRDTLLNWRVELLTDIESMKSQMDRYGDENLEWKKKTEFAYRMNLRLFNVIQTRLLQVSKPILGSDLFMKVAEEVLPAEMFNRIMDRTQKLTGDNI